MDKHLFLTTRGPLPPPADTVNRAGGKAYALAAKEALAQYAAAGCFGGTYYASAGEQLAEVRALLAGLDPVFVAKCAVYSRERAWLKDMPAFLLAYLTSQFQKFDENEARRAFAQAFPRVVDNAKMLRNFVQVVRSGAIGRKSFGTAVQRQLRNWLLARSDQQLFRDQVGDKPSLADIIKMVRPNPGKGTPREALHHYILGKPLTEEVNLRLPMVALQYEAFKGIPGQERVMSHVAVPEADFRQLDSLQLTTTEWKQVFERAGWMMTRMNLNTALRHGVLNDPEMVKLIADRLRNPELVRKSRNFPFALLMAFKAADRDMPQTILSALQDAMEVATENIPALPRGLVVCVDVSASMVSPVTGARGKPTQVTCRDAAALVAASLIRKNPDVLVLPFSDRLNTEYRPNPRDSVMTIAQQIAALPSGGTDCSLPLQYLNGVNNRRMQATGITTVIMLSDNESWIDRSGGYYTRLGGTGVMTEWGKLKQRNPNAKLICVDMAPNNHTQAPNAPDRLNIGGFNDTVFNVIERFVTGDGAHWVKEIESIDLDARSVRA